MSKQAEEFHKDDPTLFTAPQTIKTCLLSWVCPGLGHWSLGRKQRALMIGVSLWLSLLLGLIMGGDLYPITGEGIIRSVGSICQLGAGAPMLLIRMLVERGTPLSLTYDYGTNYFLIAGMLNWLAVIDSFDISVGRK